LRGKIAVNVSSSGALDAPGPVKSHVGAASERWAVLKAAGAIGIATMANPRGRGRGTAADGTSPGTDAGDAASSGGGRGPGAGRGPQKAFLLADPELQESADQKVAITIARRGGDKFFAGSGHTMEEILKLATENRPLPQFPLVGTLRTKAAVRRETVEAPNVAGILRGGDGTLNGEYG